MSREELLKEAHEKLAEARSRFFAAKTSKARRDADEDIQFWGGRAAMYENEKGWAK